jgi:perosamine synthetase
MAPPSAQNVIPYSSIFIDFSFRELVKFTIKAIQSNDRTKLQSGLERVFLRDLKREKLMVCLSVRTSLDLVLQALNLPPGSEVILTAINIPQMVKILRYHGLVPIPVDVDVGGLAPKLEDIKRKITPRTKVLMLSFIFGAFFDAEPIHALAKEHGIFTIEDMAESFADIKNNGSPNADMSTFSFGTIKTQTALGGCVTVIRNNEVIYRRMRELEEKYEMESNYWYIKKIVKTLPVMLALNNTDINQMRKYLNYINYDYKDKAVSLVRGFKEKEDFLTTFRKRVPTPLFAMLYLRLHSFDKAELDRSTKRQLEGQQYLLDQNVIVPGYLSKNRCFWLFPVIVPDVQLCYKMMNDRGVDAYMGTTQLDLVEPPIGSTHEYPTEACYLITHVLYLPIHKNVPKEAIKKISDVAIDVINSVKAIKKNTGPVGAPKL